MYRKIFAALGLALVGALALAGPASATDTPDSFASCKNLADWYVNNDESDRKPSATEAGLEFSGKDLIHHEVTGLSVAALEPGTFELVAGSDVPDQPSFFSVEVNKAGGGGYGTLRWNPATSKWSMVANGGTFYEDASAAKVVEDAGKGTLVTSFGVGFTANPPGTTTVIVKAVHFNGATWNLTCPKTSASPTPTKTSASPTKSASATPTRSVRPTGSRSSAAGVAGPSLPVTGPGIGVLVGSGAVVLALGIGLVVATRRRRSKFAA
jgi:hypothetical protein